MQHFARFELSLVARIGATFEGQAGPLRYGEIRKRIDGVSQKMLTQTLRGLERDGLVTRTVTPQIPPRVDYELTPIGRSLCGPLTALGEWAKAHMESVLHARAQHDALVH